MTFTRSVQAEKEEEEKEKNKAHEIVLNNVKFSQSLTIEHRNYDDEGKYEKGNRDRLEGTFTIHPATTTPVKRRVHIKFSWLKVRGREFEFEWIKNNIWGWGDYIRLKIVLDAKREDEKGVFYFKNQNDLINNRFEYRHNLPTIFTQIKKEEFQPFHASKMDGGRVKQFNI